MNSIFPAELFTSVLKLFIFTNRYFCPANCSGRGICHHGKVHGCQCFDSNDDSKACINSPIQQPEVMPMPNLTTAPTIIDSNYPSGIPSYSPTENASNFPSVLAAIVGPTVNDVSEEVPPEEYSSLMINQSRLSLVLLLILTYFIF